MKHIIKLAVAYMRKNGYTPGSIREIIRNEGWMLFTLAQFEEEDRHAGTSAW